MLSGSTAPGAARSSGRALLFGLLLAGALLAWFFRRVDAATVVAELGDARWRWVALAALFQTAALAARGWRWHALIRRRGEVPLGAAVAATYAGWVALVVLPARLGELARPWLLGRRHPIDRSFAFGAQLLERLLDLACLLGLLAVYLGLGAPSAASPAGAELRADLQRASRLLSIVVAALGALVVAAAAAPPLRAALGARLGAPQGTVRARLLDGARAFAAGVTGIRTEGALAIAGGQSALLWGVVCAGHWCLFRAFGLELPALAVAPLLFLAVLGALVPVPAAVGSYHAAVQLALGTLLGVPLATATAYALVSHAVAYGPNLMIGSLLLAADRRAAAGAAGERPRDERHPVA
ncbi:MAG TPA: lysylphosphatidylglycerol synthase transmembrane domain-containing protein [Thermoanaerobaculia bacterium]|jgi:hypothetical protein